MTFTVTKTARGRRVGRRCVAATGQNRHDHSCTRLLAHSELTHAEPAGRDELAFAGKVGRRTLAPSR